MFCGVLGVVEKRSKVISCTGSENLLFVTKSVKALGAWRRHLRSASISVSFYPRILLCMTAFFRDTEKTNHAGEGVTRSLFEDVWKFLHQPS